jgi:hypothetical protein
VLRKGWAAAIIALALIVGCVVGFTHPITTPKSKPTSLRCTLSAKLVPSCGVLWGAHKLPGTGETWATAETNLEAQVGRPFDLVSEYHDFSGAGISGMFPDSYEQQLAASGHIIFENWTNRVFSTGVRASWAAIAAGKYDASVVEPVVRHIKAFGKPMFLSFDSEMDGLVGRGSGTAAQFVAAYRHIHNVFAQLGVTNVVWVWTVTGWSGHDELYPSLYPGDAYVDWIGYDPYNFASCRNEAWRSAAAVIDTFYQWLTSNGHANKPFMLQEYGTVTDPSNANAAAEWYQALPAALALHPNIKAVNEFDEAYGPCDTSLTLDPGELAAFAAAGQTTLVKVDHHQHRHRPTENAGSSDGSG